VTVWRAGSGCRVGDRGRFRNPGWGGTNLIAMMLIGAPANGGLAAAQATVVWALTSCRLLTRAEACRRSGHGAVSV